MLRALALAPLLLFAGCTAPPTRTPADTTGTTADGDAADVLAKDNVFSPVSYEAKVGEPVAWQNVGRNHHTVTVQDPKGGAGQWLQDSEDMPPDASFDWAFPAAGTYDVFCKYHSQGSQGVFNAGEMVMKVVVE